MHSTVLSLGDLVVEECGENSTVVLVKVGVGVFSFLEVLDHDIVGSLFDGCEILKTWQGKALLGLFQINVFIVVVVVATAVDVVV